MAKIKLTALDQHCPVRLIILTCIGVFVSAWASSELTRLTNSIATLSFANALLITILFNKPLKLWPVALSAGFIGNLLANLVSGDAISLALILSTCNLFEILLVAVPLRRWAGPALDLSHLPHLSVFVLLSGLLAPAVAGAAAALLLHYLSAASLVTVWAAWYPADALGYLVFTPLFLMLRMGDVRGLLRVDGRFGRIVGFAALVAVTVGVFYQSDYPLLFIPMAVLGFIVIQLGPTGTALGIVFIAIVATVATINGHGPMMLGAGDLSIRIFVLQGFVASIVLAKLPLIAILSDRKRLEAKINEANRQLLLAEKIAQLGHWHFDPLTRELTWSDGVYAIHGLDPAIYQPEIETAIAAYHPDDRADVARHVNNAITEAQESDFALRVIRGDGAVRDIVARVRCQVDDNKKVTDIFGTIVDVTELRQAERTVVRSEARYRLLADHASDVILLSHSNGHHSYVSPAVKSMLGYTVDEAYGVGMRDWVHPDDLPRWLAAMEGITPQQPTVSVTYRLRHKAGHYIWAEAACKLVVEEGDEDTIVMTIRNVTERVQQARRLETARIEAEDGARIKAEFLANMSHELRTPLSGILGVHDLLQNDLALSEPQRHLVHLARESGRSLLTIVNDILDFSKIEAGQVAIEQVPFSLHEQIESCCRLGRQAIKHIGVTLEAKISTDVPDILVGDPTRVRQVLLNLIMNAVKFTQDGHIGVHASYANHLLRLDVTDTGIGIAANKIPYLFERFSQADGSTARQFGGTGLGLAISKRLIELMEGHIGVESVLGRGSTFWLTLPLIASEAEERENLQAIRPTSWPLNGRKILVAEDNMINQEIIRIALTEKGLQTTIVEDGAGAVEAFCNGRFDVILMDVQMPTMDGLDATAAIRALERAEQRRATPIIALTANMMVEETERCRQAGMDAHIGKPIEWGQLFQTIERLCTSSEQEPAAMQAAPQKSDLSVLDESVLDDLSALLGRDKIAALLKLFQRDTERRLSILESSNVTEYDLFAHAHAVVSSAGQLGFKELSALCTELEAASREGGGLDRVAAFRIVADRAIEAATSSSYIRAA